MSKDRNDNAFMLTRLHDRGVKLAIITSRSLGLKGKGKLPPYENMNGVPVYRLYKDRLDRFLFPTKRLKKVLQIARTLRPDLILCSQQLNMRLALKLQGYLKIPIVLLVEDAGRIFSSEHQGSLKMRCVMRLLGIPIGRRYWPWLCEKAATLITCHPRDREVLGSLSKHGKPVFYLPWPAYIPDDLQSPARVKGRGIYAGSLSPQKNTQEFKSTLPRILENTPTKEFLIIGTGPHVEIVKKLQKENHDAIKYIPQLPRKRVLNLISSSYYAYSPSKKGGWGFIGDCWGLRTPIVMSYNDDYVTNKVNALVAKSENDLIKNINSLYEYSELYKKMQRNGYEEYKKRKADAVGDELYSIFKKTLERNCA